jgi:Group 4 capsule polysaccharide lipoprotein gfcB, YjbF
MGKGVAVTVLARLVVATLALAMFGGCGSERSGDGNPVAAALGTMAKSTVSKLKAKKSGGGTATAPAPVSRVDLEEYGVPILRVTSTVLGQDGFLTISDAKGDVQTWSTPDGVSFSLRNGVLIQTRGLGADLMSSQGPTVAQIASGGSYQRVYFYLGADDAATRRTFDCVAAVVGPETIEVVGRSHSVTHVTETCTQTGGKRTNEYWVEGSTIRKSRQIVSAQIGYIDFERVID